MVSLMPGPSSAAVAGKEVRCGEPHARTLLSKQNFWYEVGVSTW